MKLHEYQAKALFREYGIPTPKGVLVDALDKLEQAARSLGGDEWIVKAQVHASERSQVGGVRWAHGMDELRKAGEALLGQRLHTGYGGPGGQRVDRLLLEAPVQLEQEIYFVMQVDRSLERVVCRVSQSGGSTGAERAGDEIEIVQVEADAVLGFMPFHYRQLSLELDLSRQARRRLAELMQNAYRLFRDKDLVMLRINPLALTGAGELVALDAKLTVDDNALDRQPDLRALHDAEQVDAIERAAEEHGLHYVRLDGDIGCMVNGAGLAMATMDLLKLHGGEPANFLDVGGHVYGPEQVAKALRLILSDGQVKAVLVNIFGGIVRCDLIAQGMIEAAGGQGLRVPVVVRMQGTEAYAGLQALAASDLGFITTHKLEDAARLAVEAARAGVAA